MKLLFLLLIIPTLAFSSDLQNAKQATRKIVRKPAQASVHNTQLFIGHNLTPSTDVLPRGALLSETMPQVSVSLKIF
jgi:hypothetical protein